jgi:hypothetical protein
MPNPTNHLNGAIDTAQSIRSIALFNGWLEQVILVLHRFAVTIVGMGRALQAKYCLKIA